MKSGRRKLLAVAVAASLIASYTSANANLAPACIPEDPMVAMDNNSKNGKGKRKTKKGYFY